jgi:hypothetical protein
MLLRKPTSTAISFDAKTKNTSKETQQEATNELRHRRRSFLLPPTTLFAPFATGLLSYLVPYSIYYPPTNLFTTCLSHYFPITLPNTLFFFYLPTYFLLSLILMMYITEVAITIQRFSQIWR